jgi:hypothetical protein
VRNCALRQPVDTQPTRTLSHGRVFIETPLLITDDELADGLALLSPRSGPPRAASIRKSDPSPCAKFATVEPGDEHFTRAGPCRGCSSLTPPVEQARKVAKKFRTDDETVIPPGMGHLVVAAMDEMAASAKAADKRAIEAEQRVLELESAGGR